MLRRHTAVAQDDNGALLPTLQGAQGAAPSQRPGVLPPFGARRRSLDAASSSDPNDPRVSVEAAEAEHLATQLAQMRLDLARKQAEIDRLQGRWLSWSSVKSKAQAGTRNALA